MLVGTLFESLILLTLILLWLLFKNLKKLEIIVGFLIMSTMGDERQNFIDDLG
jgi:mannose/fructose/N-acetylgalactosamine-specific phosphotransferase system component IID